MIVLYLFYINQKDNFMVKNNCYFQDSNCSYDFIYNFTSRLDKNYNSSMNTLRGFILNGT